MSAKMDQEAGMRWIVTVAAMLWAVALADPGSAQTEREDDGEGAGIVIGGDLFEIAGEVTRRGPVDGDAFLAGETVRSRGPIAGSLHLAGRRVAVEGAVGGAVYAAGYRIELDAPVTGPASLVGAEIRLGAPLKGNLRASGSDIALEAEIAGAALLAARTVRLSAPILGDAAISAREVSFGEGARVGGMLTLRVPDPAAVSVPASVVPPDRLRLEALKRDGPVGPDHDAAPGNGIGLAMLGSYVLGVAVVAATAALAVALAPDGVARLRVRALSMPGGCLLTGVVALSAATGLILVLALSLVGLLLVPVALLLAALFVFAGYVAGSYVLGAGIWTLAGRPMPQRVLPRSGLAALGAAAAAVVFLVPVLGQIGWLALVCIGLGTLTAPLFARFGLLADPL